MFYGQSKNEDFEEMVKTSIFLLQSINETHHDKSHKNVEILIHIFSKNYSRIEQSTKMWKFLIIMPSPRQ